MSANEKKKLQKQSKSEFRQFYMRAGKIEILFMEQTR